MTSTFIWDLWENLSIDLDTNIEEIAPPREGQFMVFRLLKRKRRLRSPHTHSLLASAQSNSITKLANEVHQTRTTDLWDLLERILYKGMFIPGNKYLRPRSMNILTRTNPTEANGHRSH